MSHLRHTYQHRPISIPNKPAKETNIHQQRPVFIKRDLYTLKDIYKRGILQPIPEEMGPEMVIRIQIKMVIKRDLDSSKETYIH